ncbi:MAG TPA: IPT/TIG domain-containing protein, partial [Thermoanaerobaculia bacterium]|nr:IPT/TIG domain-containing protein [Thermoanaerobaculia bacterium]
MRYFFATLTLIASLSAAAAPQVVSIAPRVGFTYGLTRVELRGSGFTSTFIRCEGLPANLCPVQVFFGDQQAAVVYASPDQIIALAPPQAHARAVNVRVVTTANETATAPHIFVYEDHAKPAGNYRQYLVPLALASPAGAHGSIWRTELMVHNGTSIPLVMYARFCSFMPSVGPCDRLEVAPVQSEQISVDPSRRGDGAFIYVPEPLAPNVDFKLFARDISREAEGWGTEIPVVPASDFAGSIRLLDVPVDPRFRATLRV